MSKDDNGLIDQSSFASILAGVKKMRDAYEPVVATTNTSKPPGTEASTTQETSTDVTTSHEATRHEASHTSSEASRLSTSELHGDVSTHSGDFTTTSASRAPRPSQVSPDTRTDNITGIARENRSGTASDARLQPRASESRNRLNESRRRHGPRVQTYTSVQVANSQKGNPLLESPLMKLTPWSYNSSILSDYYINATLQILFLLLKYHKLRPEYVWRRIEKLKGTSEISDNDQVLRVLLVVVDIDSPQETIRHLLSICFKQNLSMIIAWSFEEAGNYIAYFKQNELAGGKIESSIQGVRKGDYNLNIVSTLTSVRAVNKTDVANLLANCKLFRQVVLASAEEGLGDIPGLGDRKLQNLRSAFSEPFIFNKEYD